MSGWRAALVAAVVGGLVLAAGFFFTRTQPPNGTVTTLDEAAASLTCAEAVEHSCRLLANELGVPYLNDGNAPQSVLITLAGNDIEGYEEIGRFAASPVVLGVWTERASVLAARGCNNLLDLECLITHLGERWDSIGGRQEWGEIRIGLADPSAGPAELAAWRGVAEPDVPTDLAAGLRLKARNESDLLDTLALRGPASTDSVVATEAALVAHWETFLPRGRISFFYPDPGPYVDYVILASGRRGRDLAQQLLSPELAATLGSLGFRPVTGPASTLHEAMGEPGVRLPEMAPADVDALEARWES